MFLFRQKLSKVKCGECSQLIPLRQWREHTLQHSALCVLSLQTYPTSFLALTQHYCRKLEEIEGNDNRNTVRSQLTAAYDTLKMLYFKDFKREDRSHPAVSPSFEKMTESLAPRNFNYNSCDSDGTVLPPPPYSYSITIQQLKENIFHTEEPIQELSQAFFTADPVTPDCLEDDLGCLWGCGVFEGLKGPSAAKYVSGNYWASVREHLERNTCPSPRDIRHAMKRATHMMDVELKQGHHEVGQSRWSGVTMCTCVIQTTPNREVDNVSRASKRDNNSRASTEMSVSADTQGHLGMLHIANIGSLTAVLCRDGVARRITYNHVTSDKAERQRVLDNGASVSSSGQVNSVTSVTRALGFHGDPTLRQCISQKPYCNSVPLFPNDEYIIIANATFLKYIGLQEACNMCRALLIPSVRKLVHIFTSLPDQVQDEAVSQSSTLDYDALVSDFDENSQGSSMVPDNESEENTGEEIDWNELFDDPIENLDEAKICKMLSEAMSNSLVEGVRMAGAVGPVVCSVILLEGSLQAARRRLLYEQAIYELKQRYHEYALSEVSLMSFADRCLSVAEMSPVTPSSALTSERQDTISALTPSSRPYSRQVSSEAPWTAQIADHLTLDTGHLVYGDHGILQLQHPLDLSKYNNLNMEGLRLEDCGDNLSKQDKRALVRDMVTLVLQHNNTEDETSPALNLNSTATTVT